MDKLLSPLILSALVATVATVFAAVIGLAIAYLLARYEFKGKNLLDSLVTIPMVLPPTVIGYYLIIIFGREGIIGKPLYQLTGWSFMFTWQGAALAATVVALPLMIKVSKAAIESVHPDMIKVSYSLGKSEWETFVKVILPIARGGIIAGTILSFARALGEFGATLMIAGNIPGRTNTMPLSIYSAFQSGDDELAQYLVIILTCISIAVIYIANKLTKSRWT